MASLRSLGPGRRRCETAVDAVAAAGIRAGRRRGPARGRFIDCARLDSLSGAEVRRGGAAPGPSETVWGVGRGRDGSRPRRWLSESPSETARGFARRRRARDTLFTHQLRSLINFACEASRSVARRLARHWQDRREPLVFDQYLTNIRSYFDEYWQDGAQAEREGFVCDGGSCVR